jgi:hypothetical protein
MNDVATAKLHERRVRQVEKQRNYRAKKKQED